MKIKDYISMIILLSFYFLFWYCLFETTSFLYGILYITIWLISINFNKKIRYTILLLCIILSLILFFNPSLPLFNTLYGWNLHFFYMVSLFLQVLWLFFQFPIWDKKDKEDKTLKSHNSYIYFLFGWIWILLLTIIGYLLSIYFSPEQKDLSIFFLLSLIFTIFCLPIFVTDIIILLIKKINWKRKIRKIIIFNYIYCSLALLISITYFFFDWFLSDWIWFAIILWCISYVLYIYLLIFWLIFLTFLFLKEELTNKKTWRKYNYIKLIISWIIVLFLLWHYSHKKYSECFWKQECFFDNVLYLNEQEINELYKPIKYDWRFFFMENCKEKWWTNFVKREFNKRKDTFICKKGNEIIDSSTYSFNDHHL